ncbi:MAG: hypothetical protein J6P66_07945 [Bacteroidaceae bacterium]|nr:hypothetical protein [Bacteroidaceae bacterium]MBO7112064.1 hypothetical protein [Bacteroidaceae bacterium]
MKKTLFIGLGGCGLETVALLAKKLAVQENDDVKYMYLYIDTDEETRSDINEKEGNIISTTDFINLGDTNPYKVYDQASKGAVAKGNDPKYKRILEWASTQELGHITFPNHSLADGAMAQRMIGRMGLAKHSEAIKKALTDRLVQFQTHKDAGSRTVESDIWVVASSCGGTGSSLSLDLLYLINRITNEQQTKDAYVKLVLFMPEPFIEHNKGKAHEVNNHIMNGYSYIWELNAFKQRIVDGGKDIFSYFSAYPWGYRPGEQYDLCRFVIPVDVETNRNTKIGMNNLYSTTAEMMYYLNVGSGAREIVSRLCNDIVKASKPSTDLTKFSDSPYKWGTWLVPYGYHVIRKADLEFKDYMKTRATLEILRDGLLGEGMGNDPKLADEARKKFAATYILPFLTDVDGITAAEDSVQTHIDEEFNVGKLNPEDLDATRVRNYVRKVDDALDNTTAIQDEYLEKIKTAINTGIGKEVAEHGLKYTITLLNHVDDIYLTNLNSGILSKMETEAENNSLALRAELDGFIGKGINKKNASAAAQTGKKYYEARKNAACIKITRKIIDGLTVFPEGYLEQVRKGNGVDRSGLQKLCDMVSSRVVEAETAYSTLARQFIESQNDALTLYLPSLVNIANGENGTWAQDNEFEKLYYTSILDYDHERARGINGVRVPARLNGGSNNLTYYIQQLLLKTDTALFVNLAMEDPVICQNKFDKIINDVLSQVLDKAVTAEGTPADIWLKRSLEEYITINKKDIDFETLTNPDLIPILYPMKAAHTDATLTRYLYVGASMSLAEKFGFVPNAENTSFEQDKNMSDRFQIIKIPVGLDFYSYKYFDKIQDHYFQHREGVLAEREGCHIHKAFRFLDLDKSLAAVREPAKLEAVRYFLKNLFYQQVILKLKEKEPVAYRDLMGLFDVFDFTVSNSNPTPTPNSNQLDISEFLSGAPASEPKDNVVELGSGTVQDEFFNARLQLVNPLGMNITMHNAGVDTSCHFFAELAEETYTLADVRTPKLFAEALLDAVSYPSSISLMTMMGKVDEIEKALQHSSIKDAVYRVKSDARIAFLTAGDKNNPNFAVLLNAWIKQNHSENELLLNEVRQFLNNIIR